MVISQTVCIRRSCFEEKLQIFLTASLFRSFCQALFTRLYTLEPLSFQTNLVNDVAFCRYMIHVHYKMNLYVLVYRRCTYRHLFLTISTCRLFFKNCVHVSKTNQRFARSAYRFFRVDYSDRLSSVKLLWILFQIQPILADYNRYSWLSKFNDLLTIAEPYDLLSVFKNFLATLTISNWASLYIGATGWFREPSEQMFLQQLLALLFSKCATTYFVTLTQNSNHPALPTLIQGVIWKERAVRSSLKWSRGCCW